ncbi:DIMETHYLALLYL ADENOSINE TRNA METHYLTHIOTRANSFERASE [Salix purpurea]|uniref:DIMETHYLALLYL ADENOSINE TRNA METHYLTHIOTRANSFERASE n=1 Tax=Salix purpurea TaxID=77065 RepID=A0A9Q0TIM0_SALPP|nr:DIMETHYLALLYL ADENOSINE TRNA METHYLTHIOTRANSFERASE [Salix purpurea]
MASLTLGGFSSITVRTRVVTRTSYRPCRISCVNWDPEGLYGQPQTGHLARREMKRRFEKDAEFREELEQQAREEKQRRHALRQSRVIPDTPEKLIEYFLDTEAQEIEFEIARLKPRLNQEFFSQLQFELGQLRFAVSKTEEMEDRLIELEALQKALQEGTEAYDKLQGDLVQAKKSLTKILTSKDVKTTLLEMVELNEINRSLLTLLDENIASANQGKQKEAAAFMEKLRAAVLKYMTV